MSVRTARLGWPVTALSLAMALIPAALARAQDNKPKLDGEIVVSFKEGPDKLRGFERTGPDVKDLVRFDANGLRTMLPAGHPKVRPGVGVSSDVIVKGDFEITVKYEILDEPAPSATGEFGTRLALIVGLEAPNHDSVKFSRAVRAKWGSEYLVYSARWNPADGKHEKRFQGIATETKKGGLRLVREDTVLSFFVADGDDAEFRLLRSYAFATEDLKTVRIVSNTDGPKASLDVRVSELRLRMGGQENQALPVVRDQAAPQGQAPDPKEPGQRGWLMAGLVIGMAIALFVAVAIAVGLYVGRRQRAQSPAPEPSSKD
jgi:hypothetical protein